MNENKDVNCRFIVFTIVISFMTMFGYHGSFNARAHKDLLQIIEIQQESIDNLTDAIDSLNVAIDAHNITFNDLIEANEKYCRKITNLEIGQGRDWERGIE